MEGLNGLLGHSHVQEGLEICEAAGAVSPAPAIEQSISGAIVPAMQSQEYWSIHLSLGSSWAERCPPHG